MEWSLVNATSEGFKLKKELLVYFEQHHAGFGGRFKVLSDKKTRKFENPYRLLSAHVHAQSALVLPKVAHLSDLVRPKDACLECASMSSEVSEYLNDCLLCIYRSRWKSLPTEVQSAAVARFGPDPALAALVT